LAWMEAVQRIWTSSLSAHRPALYPAEEWDELLDIKISKLALEAGESIQAEYASLVKAGLHLMNESLDKSHSLSQGIDNTTASYWHGIMHRMEGDYSNAKYWFRMVGKHPVFILLHQQARQEHQQSESNSIINGSLKSQLEKLMAGPVWDPYVFIDLVQHQVNVAQEDGAEELLKQIQSIEMKLLLQYSIEQTGGALIEL
jgi:hypothetical protein